MKIGLQDPFNFWLRSTRRARATDSARHAFWRECAEQVLEWCHPWQRNLCQDPSRRIAILTGGRCGKTTGIGFRYLRRGLVTPKAQMLFIATSREQAMDLLWANMKDQTHQLGIFRECNFHDSALRMTFPNEAWLKLVGADDKKDIEKWRGIPWHEVWPDECGSYDRKLLEWLLERVLPSRLGDYKGTLGIAGTPAESLIGKFYDITRSGSPFSRHWDSRDDDNFAGWDGWSLHTWTARQAAPYAPRIASAWEEMEREAKRNGWGPNHPVKLREHDGIWAQDDADIVFRYRPHLFGEDAKEHGLPDGAPWNEWDPPKDPRTGIAKLPELGREDGWRYVWGFDLGAADPFACEVFAWHLNDATKTLYHCFEHTQIQMYSKAIAELILGPELDHKKPGGLVGAIGWPDGTAVDCAGLGENMLLELQRVYGITLEAAKKGDKLGDIELFNGDLVDGRIKILRGSALAGQLIENQWARDDYGERKRNRGQRDDAADAAVYARAEAHHLLSQEAPKPVKEESTVWTPPQATEEMRSRGEFDGIFDDDGLWD